jgi:hypothetical protein
MRPLRYELIESARRSNAALLGVLGVAIGYLPYWAAPDTKWSIRYFIIGATFAVVAIAILCDLVWRLSRLAQAGLPRVRRAFTHGSAGDTERLLLLLEPSELFAYDQSVSIYAKLDGLEVMLGLGEVRTIQEDRAIQILVTRQDSAYTDEWLRIFQNEKTLIDSLIVRPSVPRMAIGL